MNIWLPTLEQILILHERLILKTGGASGVRDIGLIQSALARPEASYGGVELYPGLLSKAAAICSARHKITVLSTATSASV